MNTAFRAGLAAAAVLALASPVQAAIINRKLDFTSYTNGPIAFHAGSLSFSHDDVTLETVLTDINFSIGGTTFTTENTSIGYYSAFDEFVVGGTISGIEIESETEDFLMGFRRTTNSGYFFYITSDYSRPSYGDVYLTSSTAVPEPSTWAFMIVGMGLAGAAIRGRRRAPLAS